MNRPKGNGKKRPAMAKAFKYLSEGFRSETWSAGESLPSLHRLARSAGVSLVTMWKAVQAFAEKGKLTVKMGGRITAAASPQSTPPQCPQHPSLWQKKRVQIEQDLRSGAFTPGELLPSLSELQARYGMSYLTLKKILSSLVTDKALVPFKRTYRVPGVRGRRFQSAIAIFASGEKETGIGTGSQRTQELIQSVENECAKSDITVLFFAFDYFDPSTMDRLRTFLSTHKNMLGGIFLAGDWFLHTKHAGGMDWINGLIGQISLARKPLAVFDEMGDFELPADRPAGSTVRLFRIPAKTAGRDMARMLIQLGHTRTAYISWQHGYVWSQRRYQGAADQFKKAGLDGGCRSYTYSHLLSKYDIGWAACGLTPDEIRTYIARYSRLSEEGLENFLSYYRSYADAKIFSDPGHPVLRECRANFRLLLELSKRNTGARFFGAIHAALLEAASEEAYSIYLEPLFEQALSDSEITAWIAANDLTAIHALRYLRRFRKIPVPRMLSVAGFDNTLESFEHKLTTFNFNVPALTHIMLSFVVAPLRRLRRNSDYPLEIEGLIIQRETCGRAPVQGIEYA
jgi:DNA-binding transcriptional regulator YhcF (GntR family)